MYHFDDPEEMTPEERFKEVAAILAAGYLRLKKKTPYLPDLDSDNQKSADVHNPHLSTPVSKESSAVYRETT